jgi:hypothetical protein
MNFGRDATNISSKASLPTIPARVSTTLWTLRLGDSQEVDRTLLFLVLKIGKDLLFAATLVRPAKFLYLDA